MERNRKIGLFGGSFDPLHMGHLILAEMAADFAGLGRVLFIPTAVPPHKRRNDLTPFEMRRRIVEIGIAGNPRFELSLLEGKTDVSYTYQSILHFQRQGLGREEIHLLVGGDSLAEIASWRHPEEICRHATIVAMQRPGHEDVSYFPEGAAVIVLESGSNAISSSEIRWRVREGRSIRYLVPDAVAQFIEEHALYRTPEG
ncbi:MAG TPA: nicotinate-nucleotide adenylyltransferase [Patescibacteria group bacterium]|nr:nicotinate-nucleotide adenylyltransferase [Patescibacteria group bacterium]